MRKVSRRNFLGEVLCAIPGVALLSRTSFSKGSLGRTDIDGPNQLELLKSITWNYETDDIDPICYIKGKPVKLFMWEIVSGQHLSYPDFAMFVITRDKVKFPCIRIHPDFVVKCNIKERRIDYLNVIRVGRSVWDYDVERDKDGKPVIYRLDFMDNLAINLLDAKGNVIVTLS